MGILYGSLVFVKMATMQVPAYNVTSSYFNKSETTIWYKIALLPFSNCKKCDKMRKVFNIKVKKYVV
jgi:hypothetical protein